MAVIPRKRRARKLAQNNCKSEGMNSSANLKFQNLKFKWYAHGNWNPEDKVRISHPWGPQGPPNLVEHEAEIRGDQGRNKEGPEKTRVNCYDNTSGGAKAGNKRKRGEANSLMRKQKPSLDVRRWPVPSGHGKKLGG